MRKDPSEMVLVLADDPVRLQTAPTATGYPSIRDSDETIITHRGNELHGTPLECKALGGILCYRHIAPLEQRGLLTTILKRSKKSINLASDNNGETLLIPFIRVIRGSDDNRGSLVRLETAPTGPGGTEDYRFVKARR